jgi:hypothetical protein
MRKRIVSVLLIMLFICIMAIPVAARWSNIERITLDLTFSNNQAHASGLIRGRVDTASIVATFSLQEQVGNNWVTIHTWPQVSVSGRILTFSDSAAATPGRNYRLNVVTTVTNTAGTPETATEFVERRY